MHEVLLLDSKKQWLTFLAICLAIFSFSILLEYQNYSKIDLKNPIEITARVLNQYTKTKDGKTYEVLKLKSDDGVIFYTTTKENIKNLTHRNVRIYGRVSRDCGFLDYLKSCFIFSIYISVLPDSDYRNALREFLDSQHTQNNLDSENAQQMARDSQTQAFERDFSESKFSKKSESKAPDFEISESKLPQSSHNSALDSENSQNSQFSESNTQTSPDLAALYKTLFIADPLPKDLRDISNTLGISHLIAISGFHLGILSLALGFLLNIIYKKFHARFPYRNRFFDISALTLIALFGYLVILDFTPSFLRAFAMALLGFALAWRGVKILDFGFLFAVCALCIALFPRLIFSIGFFLSASGVFYIYLFLRHFAPNFFKNGSFFQNLKSKNPIKSTLKLLISALFFNFIIFINMLPLAHFWFPIFSTHTILSVPLTLLFSVFFPASILAHALNFGYIFDSILSKLFSLQMHAIEFYAPLGIFATFIALSLLAVRHKVAYFALVVANFAFFIFLYLRLFAIL